MKFIKPVDLWDESIVQAIKQGNLKLQKGQWVRCGSGQLSRFIQYKPHSDTFDCVHYPVTKAKFSIRSALGR